MIGNPRAIPTIPTTDIDRAKRFYGDKLGFRELDVSDPAGGAYYETSPGSRLYVYPRGASEAQHTLAAFMVEEFDRAVEELRSKGVRFEDYDLPEMGIKTRNGVATFDGGMKTAWFKDPDQNILALESNVG